MSEAPELRGERLRLRAVAASDVVALTATLSDPAVGHWWPAFDRARVEAESLHPDPDVTIFTIELDGLVVGAIQYTEETEPDFRHASIDLFLDPAVHGRGLGPEAIRLVAAHLIDERGHHRLTIDPAIENEVAIRAYEKVGLRSVGRLRRYQRMGDGTWADGLLTDLLAVELVR